MRKGWYFRFKMGTRMTVLLQPLENVLEPCSPPPQVQFQSHGLLAHHSQETHGWGIFPLSPEAPGSRA